MAGGFRKSIQGECGAFSLSEQGSWPCLLELTTGWEYVMKVMIQQALARRGKTLYRLSSDLEIPYQTVYDWQRLNKMPRQEYLDLICHYLQCGIGEILKPENPDYSA